MGVECGDANLLGALVAGALPEAERAAIANHAGSCERCHALIEGLVEAGAADDPSPGPGELLARSGGCTASMLGRRRGTRGGTSGAAAPVVAVPDTSEFGGTDRFAVVRRIGAGGMGVV